MELVDEAEFVPAQGGAAGIVHAGGRATRDIDLAAIGLLEQAGDVEQGRLARARRRHEGDDLARPDREIRPAQHFEDALALRIAADDLRQEQGGRRAVRTP